MLAEILTDPDFRTVVQIERRTRGVDSYGRATESVTPGSIVAVVQPAGADERETLPEAERGKAALSLWTLTEMDGDVRAVIDGRGWLVRQVQVWPFGAETYYQAVVVLEGGGHGE